MTDTVNTRRLALDVLLEVTEHGAYSNQVLRAVLEKYQYMEKYERAFLTRLVEGTIQHMIELDYVIDQFSKVKVKKMKPVIRNILRMGVYQIQYMDSVPDSAACNEAVKLARKSGFSTLSGFVNGVLRNIARNSGSIRYPDEEKKPVLALSVRYSMPEWIVEEWLNAYGMEQTKAILDAFSKERGKKLPIKDDIFAGILFCGNCKRRLPQLSRILEKDGRLERQCFYSCRYNYDFGGDKCGCTILKEELVKAVHKVLEVNIATLSESEKSEAVVKGVMDKNLKQYDGQIRKLEKLIEKKITRKARLIRGM